MAGAIRAVIEAMDPVTQFVQQVCPLINDCGWAYYFTPETIERGKELGLGGMVFYVAGRGGMLGDCEGEVVAAAFGYFNPPVVVGAWEKAKQAAPIRDIGRAYFECAAQHGRMKLSNIANLESFNALATKVNDAADPDGLPLYATYKYAEFATDAPGRAMQLVATLREFRGSAHLLAIRAMGLTSKQAHFVKRPNDIAMFGWTEADTPLIDEEVRQKMREIEDLTDRLVAQAYSVLTPDEQAQFATVMTSIFEALTT